ncbi:unnamed protein product, partial [Amoebophrya sp. A25]
EGADAQICSSHRFRHSAFVCILVFTSCLFPQVVNGQVARIQEVSHGADNNIATSDNELTSASDVGNTHMEMKYHDEPSLDKKDEEEDNENHESSASFVALLARHQVPSHNPEHSCERRITDWPQMKRMLTEYADGQLYMTPEGARGWQWQKHLFMHNPDLDFCPVGLLTYFLTDTHIRMHHKVVLPRDGNDEVEDDESALLTIDGKPGMFAGDSFYLHGDDVRRVIERDVDPGVASQPDRSESDSEEVVQDSSSSNSYPESENFKINIKDYVPILATSTNMRIPRAIWHLIDSLLYYEELFWQRLDMSMILWSGWPSLRIQAKIQDSVREILRKVLIEVGQSRTTTESYSTRGKANTQHSGAATSTDSTATNASAT